MSILSDPDGAFLLGIMLIGLAAVLPMLFFPPRILPPRPKMPPMPPMPPMPRADCPELDRLARQRLKRLRDVAR